MNERYREAAAHIVKEGAIMSECATCKVAMEAISKLATGEWVLCNSAESAYPDGYDSPNILYYAPVELP